MWMGEFPDSVIWQKSQMKSRGFARKRTVKGVGGESQPSGFGSSACPAEVMGIKKNNKDMVQTPEFKQPDMKHDQGSCAFELTHPKKVVLTQQPVVMAVHTLLK